MIVYEKIMTRDAPLCIIEAWYRAFAKTIPAVFGFSWPLPVYWCVIWDAEKIASFPKDIIQAGIRAREQDTLMDDCIEIAYRYLDILAKERQWPRSLTKFLSLEELNEARTVDPDFARVGRLRDGYVLMGGSVDVLSALPRLIKEANIELKDERFDNTDEIRGTVANPGIVAGCVRIVMNRDQLGNVREGDILISPMTTPLFFLP